MGLNFESGDYTGFTGNLPGGPTSRGPGGGRSGGGNGSGIDGKSGGL